MGEGTQVNKAITNDNDGKSRKRKRWRRKLKEQDKVIRMLRKKMTRKSLKHEK